MGPSEEAGDVTALQAEGGPDVWACTLVPGDPRGADPGHEAEQEHQAHPGVGDGAGHDASSLQEREGGPSAQGQRVGHPHHVSGVALEGHVVSREEDEPPGDETHQDDERWDGEPRAQTAVAQGDDALGIGAEIAPAIRAWSETQTKDAAMKALADVGVPCSAIQDTADLFRDPHLLARDFIKTVDHPTEGQVDPLRSPEAGF